VEMEKSLIKHVKRTTGNQGFCVNSGESGKKGMKEGNLSATEMENYNRKTSGKERWETGKERGATGKDH